MATSQIHLGEMQNFFHATHLFNHLGTVLLNGLFSGVVANLLQVKKRESNGLLIIGAHPFAQSLATHLTKKDLPVTLC